MGPIIIQFSMYGRDIQSQRRGEHRTQLNWNLKNVEGAVRTPAFSGMVRCWCSGDPLGEWGPGMKLVLMVFFMYVCMYDGFVLRGSYVLLVSFGEG